MDHPVSHRERYDTCFHVLPSLNDRWRVIVCKDGIQWILQFSFQTVESERAENRAPVRWRSRSYFRRRDALIRVSAALAGEINPITAAILAGLPEVILGTEKEAVDGIS